MDAICLLIYAWYLTLLDHSASNFLYKGRKLKV